MISWQKLFGRDPKFYDLLEASAAEALASARLLKNLIEKLQQPESLRAT